MPARHYVRIMVMDSVNEADDPRFPRPDPGSDPCGPPAIPTLVHCIHCDEEYDSYLIKWVVGLDHKGKPWGHWVCPVPGCDGAGFCIDIWPVDPEWRDENGEKVWFDDDEEGVYDEEDEPDSADALVDDFINELTNEIDAFDDDDDDWLPPPPSS